VGFTHFALAVRDLEKFYQELLQKGVNLHSPPQKATAGLHKDGEGVYLRTQEGVVVELIDSPLTRKQMEIEK